MNKRFFQCAALFLIALAALAPSVFNDFSGDDAFFLKQNAFYDHPANIARLFTADYNIHSEDYFLQDLADKGSGSVAYRPVLSLTYFADKALWKDRPAGFHLTNLWLHVANVLLVFWCLLRFWPAIAWLAACLFAVHPVQVEAVCSVGYRADLLACFWGLLAFWAWIAFRDRGRGREQLLSAAAYVLAVFSKESAAPLLAVFFLYDILVRDQKVSWKLLSAYALHALVLLFYVWIYLFVFPNTAMHEAGAAGAMSVGNIWANAVFHLQSFLWPPGVAMVPGLYQPSMPGGGITVAMILICAGCAYLCRGNRMALFALFWFLLFYLPVSGWIALPNPVAHRFMYLPGIGAMMLVAYGGMVSLEAVRRNPRALIIVRILLSTLIILLVVCSFRLTLQWRNNRSIAEAWIKRYPEHFKGYEILAKENFRGGLYKEAIGLYQQTIVLGNPNPANGYELGLAFFYTGQTDQAMGAFQWAIERCPDYANAYYGVGKVCKSRKDYRQALAAFQRAFDLTAQKQASHFYQLADCYAHLGQKPEADKILEMARTQLTPDEFFVLTENLKADIR